MFVERHLEPVTSLNGAPGTVILETERLIIRRQTMADAPDLAAAANYEAVAADLRDRFPSPYTLADAEGYLKLMTTSSENVYPEALAILLKPGQPGNDSPKPLYIGGVGIMRQLDVNYRTWEIGYWLTPSAWGSGYMTEVVQPFTRWCFATFPKLHRIEATAYARNEKSGRVLERCGFVLEGRLRENVSKKGEILDTVLYGLLRSDLEKSESS
jgi:ribosomal-protein-alanine N-acetyltransferase